MRSDRDIVGIYRKAAVSSGVFDIVIDAAVGIGRTNVYQRSAGRFVLPVASFPFDSGQSRIGGKVVRLSKQ